jgi:hypothetical protein
MQSTDGNSEDTPDKAFAELFKLFSKPTKSLQKAYRTTSSGSKMANLYSLSEADRILEKVFEEIFGPGSKE